jgi:hypothetical protein
MGAAGNGHKDAVRMLLDAGADTSTANKVSFCTCVYGGSKIIIYALCILYMLCVVYILFIDILYIVLNFVFILCYCCF